MYRGCGISLSIVCLTATLTSCAATPPATSIQVDVSQAVRRADIPSPAAPSPPASTLLTPSPTVAERVAALDRGANEQRSALVNPSEQSVYADGFPVVAQAPKARSDQSLQSFQLLKTGPYIANGDSHTLRWANNSGRRLAIYKAYVWTGFDRGGIADVHIEVRRDSDQSFVAILQWDHYAEPTSPQHGQQFDYPSPMILEPGETMTIVHFADGLSPHWHAHHVVILWVK